MIAAIALALLTAPAAAQTYRTHEGIGGNATTYGSDGSTARAYQGIGGSSTTYITGPDGTRKTCRSRPGISGSTATTCR